MLLVKKGGVTLTTSKANFDRQILRELLSVLGSRAILASKRVLNFYKKVVEAEIRNHPTYISLIANDRNSLRAQFGLVNPERHLDVIIQAFIRQIIVIETEGLFKIGFSSGRNFPPSSFTIRFTTGDWGSLTNLGAASFVSEGAFFSQSDTAGGGRAMAPSGYYIRWLEWLLERGDDRSIIEGYHFAQIGKYSRTGLGIMRRPGRWGVPTAYTGTKQKNFLTESVVAAWNNHKQETMVILQDVMDGGVA